ncbi:lysosomal dipeptide transporter MFSD1 isoform X2 [Heterodontus francisci]|uniref:lysosomal dipeptide transporter MFSD1 isoform X2 n=1 Tax=Heterodontus francisci TaxID=7792 RepID=UPI00355BF583
MTPQQYNLLYVIYAWTNAVVVILAGFLIDKVGNCVGIFLFSILIVIGSATFALGSHFKGTSFLLPLMLIGRLLFGSSNGSLIIVQDRIIAFWFKGTLLCVLSFLSAITVSILDKVGIKQLGLDSVLQQESKKVQFQDIRYLSLRYWLLVLTIMFFYNGIFPFVADASKFIQDKYSGYSQQEASYITGAVYDCSLVLLAVAGILIDNVGLRGILATACAVLTLPVFALLAFTFVPPLVSTIWLGVTYSFAAASLWPSIFLVVPQANVGTALGLAGSVQMIGVGLCNLIVGQILGNQSSDLKIPGWRWQQMMIFMLVNTISCTITSIVLNIVDKQQGGTLNRTTKHSEAVQEENQEQSETSPLLRDSSDENRIS